MALLQICVCVVCVAGVYVYKHLALLDNLLAKICPLPEGAQQNFRAYTECVMSLTSGITSLTKTAAGLA